MKCLVYAEKERASRRARYKEMSLTSIVVGPREPLAERQIPGNQLYGALRGGIAFSNAFQALRARLLSASPSGTEKTPFFDSLLCRPYRHGHKKY
jgi:hypothetical protein